MSGDTTLTRMSCLPVRGRPVVVPTMTDMPDWTFLTNHAHVLLCIHRDPGIRVRDVAASVGITERAAHRIVADLAVAGYLTARREGRRNHYQVDPTRPLRHPLERDHQIGEILAVLADEPGPDEPGPG